jgi:hypothetical protein
MIVLPTITESDLQEIGVVSFGVRRKIVVLAKRLSEKCQTAEIKENPAIVPEACETINEVRIS